MLALVASPVAALDAPRVVVLVTLDTTRADHLGCYGYPRPTTPFIDSLAREGVLFENAYSAISLTAPSHATLFTGLHPDQHLLWRNGDSLPAPDAPEAGRFAMLAERMAACGYATAAFTAVRWLFGITRGFAYVNLGERGPGLAHRPADETILQVIDWLKLGRSGERLFVWVHLFDPRALGLGAAVGRGREVPAAAAGPRRQDRGRAARPGLRELGARPP